MRTRKMKAVLLTAFGGYDKLAYRDDVPIPIPAHGEVLIKVGACGVNNTDIWTREGAYGDGAQSGWQGGSLDFPRIQGADIVGRIIEVGEGVSDRRRGTRVMVNPTLYGHVGEGLYDATYIGSEKDGGFAEFVCVPSVNAYEVDSPLSDEALATFMLAYLTAEHMLNRVGLKENETVLITGASGGVGSALVQLAKIRNARVAAIVGKGKEGPLWDLGVEAVITRGEEDIYGAIHGPLGVKSVDVVADVVAGNQVARLIEILGIGGRYVTAGAIAGPKVTIDWRKLYLKHLTLFGSTLGTHQEGSNIVRYVEEGKLKPLLAGTYRLDQLVEAQMEFKKKAFFGKLVIAP